jgi:thymidylate kinase
MTAVALIGGDGAGKTTVARHLCEAGVVHAKYMYMGISAQSGDHLLPTSRLVMLAKRYAYRRRVVHQTGTAPTTTHIPSDQYEYASQARSTIWVTARLANRVAEAWYRQVISLMYQARGNVVVCDRHVLFDTGVLDSRPGRRSVPTRIYRRVMRWTIRRPDAVIFLDTPGDVLVARKGETSAEYLDAHAELYLAQAAAVDRFIRVDASQPLDDVIRQVTEVVRSLDRSSSGAGAP